METNRLLSHLVRNFFIPRHPVPPVTPRKNTLLNKMTGIALNLMAFQFNFRPGLRRYLSCADGWIDFSVGIHTESRSVCKAIIFSGGRVRVTDKIPSDADVTMILADDKVVKEMASSTPNEMLNHILKNRMVIEGNIACLQLFNFYISLLMGKIHQKMLNRQKKKDAQNQVRAYGPCRMELADQLAARRRYRMKGTPGIDPGVRHLTDPFLSDLSIDDFPRLRTFLNLHFDTLPEVCAERPKLLTDWFRKNGFETDSSGTPWIPELRQAEAYRYLMENREPIIAEDDLLAGTTTSKPVGVVIYPDAHGTMIWGELYSSDRRGLNPFVCDRQTAELLHHEIFPFWMHRNFREDLRRRFDDPLCLKVDERFVGYFVWKSVGISHTIPDFKRLLTQGITGICQEIQGRLKDPTLDLHQKNALAAMDISLQGVLAYARHLADQARRLALAETDPVRKNELMHLGEVCDRVPENPARTLDEAVNAAWICWVALHMENTNTGLSVGRLDQLFQPYFAADMEKAKTDEEKTACIRHAVELLGCFYMRMTDHVPLLPDIGNYLFGGASSTQAVTLGGVTAEGEDAVNDMTYILLKVTEMLAIRDANINCRYHPEKNSDQYLQRLCEVNIITSATPIMHNDLAVFEALRGHGYPEAAINDWSATGCVEPTLSGKHFGHTGSILLNLVAAMEMALNNGIHPVMRWALGPETGRVEAGDFSTFDEFYKAWAAQQQFIIDQAVTLNNLYGEVHQTLRPTPVLSALIDGCIKNGRDATAGGAVYNSSGTSNIGLADVTDSLLVIRKLIFEDRAVSFERLKEALDNDFKDDPALLAMVSNRVPLFGSGDPAAVAMANRVAKTVHDCYRKHTNYRGGPYTSGFWSMSQHVAYGSLSGPLPSGRRAGKAFTPGLTPTPKASMNFLDNIRSVAALDPKNMDNNLAFNVKLTLNPDDAREESVERMYAYVKSYFDLGGMQMQFNVVTSEMLKDAMAHPENYRNLMVRISGYNAYFVTLNREIQIELIERTAYGL